MPGADGSSGMTIQLNSAIGYAVASVAPRSDEGSPSCLAGLAPERAAAASDAGRASTNRPALLRTAAPGRRLSVAYDCST